MASASRPVASRAASATDRPAAGSRPARSALLGRMRIGRKLDLAFGILVAVTALAIGLSYLASERAASNIARTVEHRAPVAQTAARAQADLLRMMADLRGYLALGDREYRAGYTEAQRAFEADLAELDRLLEEVDAVGGGAPGVEAPRRRIEALEAAFDDWSRVPARLFSLHDDQLQREPALRILVEEGNRPIAIIAVTINKIIDSQRRREPTARNMALLGQMASFQASLFAMISGLRGYVTTGRDSFKFEYTTNLAINDRALAELVGNRAALSEPQQKMLSLIESTRQTFLPLPERMFEWVEGERARMDLFLFRQEAIPLAETMLGLLDEITAEQQRLLQIDLQEGRDHLTRAQVQILATGLVALLLALTLALVFRSNIVGPIRRLTAFAGRLGAGDLAARAAVESRDEIGKLAETFNDMSAELGRTLDDLDRRRREQEAAARALRRQNEYLEALHRTTLGLISRLDLTELLADLIGRAAQLLDTPHGYIYLADADGAALERRIGVGVFEQSPGRRLGRGEGVAGRVWQTGEPLVVNDYQEWEGRAPSAHHSVPIRALMAVPLKSGAAIVGVLGMAYDARSDHAFSDDEVELLGRFGELASLSLENARLYSAAQEAKAVADAANEAKSSFLANVSHELRTPLTSILGFARIIQGRFAERIRPLVDADDKRTQRAIKQIEDNLAIILAEGRRLTTLINNVLDLEKIEAGRMEWRMEPLAIGAVIDQAHAATASLFAEKGLAFEREVAEGLPEIEGDKDKLIQTVINLISNAVKFTDHGSVTCRAEARDGEVVVSVIDTGLGIAAADHAAVFEKFKQVGDTLTDKPKGTGLGLPICKEIVEHHGGRIWVESAPGRGSTFAFALPVAGAATATEPPAAATEAGGPPPGDGFEPRTIDLDALVAAQAVPDAAAQGRPGRRRTVLIADDDPGIRRLLRHDLEAAGYRVVEARNGREALELVRAAKPQPDLIVLDVLMPELSGLEVAASLRADPLTMGIPILVLSVVEERERAERLGVDRYLAKPIDEERLLAEVRALLEMGISRRTVLLVVDGEAGRATALREALQGRGHLVRAAAGVEAALGAARAERPDLLLVDARLPRRHELIAALRQEAGLEGLILALVG